MQTELFMFFFFFFFFFFKNYIGTKGEVNTVKGL